MTKHEKILERLFQKPKDFTWSELETLMAVYGYRVSKKGKTSGSRRRYESDHSELTLTLHEPHPRKVLKPYQVNNVIEFLRLVNDYKNEKSE